MAGTPILFRDRLLETKRKVKILILGDYSKDTDFIGPNDICEKKLVNLKQHLIDDGYLTTRLIKDFEDEEEIPEEYYDEHFVKKSEYYIEHWGDILIFVFLKEGDNQSVIREWTHMIKICPEKCINVILLYHNEVIIRTLLRGDIKGNRITHDEFSDDETLYERASKLVFVKIYNCI